MIMVLICCIAIWLKFGMILWNRIPNAPFPYNSGHRNAVTYYLSTLWTVPRLQRSQARR